MQGAASATLAIGVSVATATMAQAACSPNAVDAATPAPGTTVTCSGATLDQNLDAGYGTGNQTGITINVGDGASLESNARIGMWVGDAVIRNGVGASVLGWTDGIIAATGSLAVTNFGSITATNGTAIIAATDVTLTNHAAGVISGGASGIVSTGGAITVDNAGSITGSTGAGISASSSVTLTNQAGGVVRGFDGVRSTAGAVSVDNAGSITGTGDWGVDALADLTVTNRAGGTISGGVRGGIQSRGGNIILDNAGSITSSNPSAAVSALVGNVHLINQAGASINGIVVTVQGDIDVHNSGNIGGVIGSNVRLVNTATGTIGGIANLGGVSDITNFGTVTNDIIANGSLINHAGARILGIVSGTGGGGVVNHAGGYIGAVVAADMSVDNSGSMGGVGLGGNSQLLNNAGASIASSTYGVVANLGSWSIFNAGTISGTDGGVQVLGGGNTFVNLAGGNILGGSFGVFALVDASITNSGNISGGNAPSAGIYANSALQLVNNAGASISGSEYGIAVVGNASIVNAGRISGGAAAIQFNAPGNTLTLLPGSVISGKVIGSGSDTLRLGGIGAGTLDISQFSGFSTFTKFDPSIWSLTGTATYNGPVNVNGGTLAVNGNLAAASLLTVNSGGILGGSGTVGVTAINGGTLAPGNSIGTLTIGSLTMTAAATYLVQVDGTLADKAIITGTAAIAGKVAVDPLARVTSTTTYTIINAGTLTGTFDTVTFTNNFARNARLTYVGNDVLLTLDPGLLTPILPGNASINNRNVARGIDNALEGGAIMPASFNGLFLLSGNNLLNALTQISGETPSGSQQTTFDAMTQFMGVLSDPFTAGRGGTVPTPFAFAEDEALAYAPNGRKRTRTERDAYAMFTKAPGAFEARWNVWAAGFGGSRTTDGNAALGSNRITGNIAGAAVGVDHWLSPETVAGFALAGGGTSFSVAGGGSGQSDLFQAGAFVRHSIASSYITATAAYGWQDIRTDRQITAVGSERLRANFNANAFSGRIEGGNRWLVPELGGVGLTPYAALQVTAFDLPSYSETSANGADGFALNYTAKTVTATRTEFGLRGDKSWAVAEGLLTLRGRAAWAHDYNSDRNVAAVFQSLPGSSFVVNGARAARNAALTSASAEMSFNGGWSVATTFEGEFSDVSRSFAGKGALRYAW
jgi:uncharacterized protein with beta-barrel porin domain